MRLVRASRHLQRAAGEDGGHHALAGVCHPDPGAEEIARHHGRGVRGARLPRPQQRRADPAFAALRLPRAVFGHHPLRIAVGVKAFGKNDDGARLACRRQDRLFGGRKLLFPGRGAVGRAVDAVEDRRRALESVTQQTGVGDIRLQLLDVWMVGPAAGAGENPDPLAPPRQLLCHRPAHRAGSGDDIQIGHEKFSFVRMVPGVSRAVHESAALEIRMLPAAGKVKSTALNC
jgi:hypothetical protein